MTAYGRPMKAGIIAIKLREGDELVDVVVAEPVTNSSLHGPRHGDPVPPSDVRAVGRNSAASKGISLARPTRPSAWSCRPRACAHRSAPTVYGNGSRSDPHLEGRGGRVRADNGIDEEAGNTTPDGADEPLRGGPGRRADEEEEALLARVTATNAAAERASATSRPARRNRAR